MTDVDAAYAATVPLLGEFAGTVDVPASSVHGEPERPGQATVNVRAAGERLSRIRRRRCGEPQSMAARAARAFEQSMVPLSVWSRPCGVVVWNV